MTARFARTQEPPPRTAVQRWASMAGLDTLAAGRQPTARDFRRACQSTQVTYEYEGEQWTLLARPGGKRARGRIGFDLVRLGGDEDGLKVATLVYTPRASGWKGPNRLEYKVRPELPAHDHDAVTAWMTTFTHDYQGDDLAGWDNIRHLVRGAVADYGVPLMDRDSMAVCDLSLREHFERIKLFADQFEGSFDVTLLRVAADDSDYTLFRLSSDLHFERASLEVVDLAQRAAASTETGPGRPPKEAHLDRAHRRLKQLQSVLPVYEKTLQWPLSRPKDTLRRAELMLGQLGAVGIDGLPVSESE